jgi:hypothetical protein
MDGLAIFQGRTITARLSIGSKSVPSRVFSVGHFAHLGYYWIGRIIVIAVALSFIYMAFFLYEDQEGKYQNRLEELWVQIDDLSRTALSRHTAFLKKNIGFFAWGLDYLFGKKLFSVRAVTITLAYSVGSFFLMLSFSYTGIGEESLKALLLLVIEVSLGTSLGFVRNKRISLIWSWMVLLVTLIIFSCATWFISGAESPLEFLRDMSTDDAFQMLGIFLGGVVCDVLFIALNRTLLRVTARLNNIVQILLLLTVNMLIAVAYLAPAFLITVPLFEAIPLWEQMTQEISSTNVITAIIAMGVVLMTGTALLHRLIWPLVERPVYSLQRHKVYRNTKFLLASSVLLLTWAIPAWKPFWDVIGKL